MGAPLGGREAVEQALLSAAALTRNLSQLCHSLHTTPIAVLHCAAADTETHAVVILHVSLMPRTDKHMCASPHPPPIHSAPSPPPTHPIYTHSHPPQPTHAWRRQLFTNAIPQANCAIWKPEAVLLSQRCMICYRSRGDLLLSPVTCMLSCLPKN